MNIGIPNHVKDLNPPLSNYDSIVKFDDIQKLNIIKDEKMLWISCKNE